MIIEFVIQLFKDTLKLSYAICNYLINSTSYVRKTTVCEMKGQPDVDLDDIK